MFSHKIIETALLAEGLNDREGLPILTMGVPGVGKTGILRQIGESLGMVVITLSAALMQPSDFLGLPIPERTKLMGQDVMITRFAVPDWAVEAARAVEAGMGVIILINEVTTCTPATQGALLRVVNEGVVGGFHLPPGVRFLLDANPPEMASGGYDLTPALANRFGHTNFAGASARQWSAYMIAGGSSGQPKPSTEEMAERYATETTRMRKAWPEAYAQSAGVVTAFIENRTELLNRMPKATDPSAAGAWPSARSWEMAIRAQAAGYANGCSPAQIDALMASFVGSKVHGEYVAYRNRLDLPKTTDLLDGKVTWKHRKDRPDITQAVMRSCATLVGSDDCPNRDARGQALWRLIGEVSKTAGDAALHPAKVLIDRGLIGVHGATQVGALRPMLEAAGLMNLY